MKPLHPWDVNVEEARQIQDRLWDRVVLKNTFRRVTKIGGADVAYTKDGRSSMAVVLVYSFPDLVRLDLACANGRHLFPYIPGLLSFREGPLLIEAFKELKVKPDVMIFEGQGIAHPRGFGLASDLGLWLNIPAVGCTKTPLIRTPISVGTKRGDFQYVWKDGKKVGAVLRTKEDVKPVFVSPGHNIDLSTSIELVLAACRGYRMPEPLRKADWFGRRVTRDAERMADNILNQ